MMKAAIHRSFGFIVKVQAVLSATLVLCLMVLVGLDVSLKYLYSHPIEGTLELTSEYLMPVSVLLGFAYAERRRGHINVDLLFRFFPAKVQQVLDRIIHLVTAAFLAVMAYSFYLRALYYTGTNAYIDLISYDLVTWPARWLATFSLATFALQMLCSFATGRGGNENG